MSTYDISIIIPVYDSKKDLNLILGKLNQISIIKGISLEVVVANSSLPGENTISYSISTYPALHIKNIFLKKKMRLGHLIRTCCAYSSGDYILTLTGEGLNEIELLETIYSKILKNVKLIIVSRFESKDISIKPPFIIYQKIYRTVIFFLLGKRVSDSTNGFRAFDRRFVQALGVNRPGLSFFAEMTIKVLQAGGSIESVAVKNQSINSKEISSKMLNLEIPERFSFKTEIFGYLFVILSAIFVRVTNSRNER
jgi:hypothetical protein